MVTLNSDLDHLEFQDPYFYNIGGNTILEQSSPGYFSVPSNSFKGLKMDKKIIKWISSLSSEERQLLLTDTCPEFTKLLIDLLKPHEQSKGKCRIAVPLVEEGKLLDSTKLKIYNQRTEDCCLINVPVYEALLFTSIRLFSKDSPFDSITVDHKLADDFQLLMDCFRYISNGKSFQNVSRERTQPRINKKKAKNIHSILENFPSWFELKVGYSIYQWITAYLEYLITTRYQVVTEGDGSLFKQQLKPLKDFFMGHNNVAKFWERIDRRKVIAEMSKKLRRTMYGNFLLYAALNANPMKFVDTLYFFPLNYQCKLSTNIRFVT
jgi:hypothetical protein